MKDLPAFDLFGLKVSVFDKTELTDYSHACVASDKTRICFGYSLGYLALFKKYPGLYEKCNAYDLMVTDGRHFYWYAKLFGAPLKFDISIPFVSELMLELSDRSGYSVMLIGSTEETNLLASENIRKKYPGAKVLPGLSGGSFSEKDQLAIVKYVNFHKPDFLFIGTSTPIKEDFASRWKDELDVKIIVPFGGVIDGLAGKVKLTPPLLKKMGLASFVRLVQEPRRLFRKNMYMISEFLVKILPITIFYRFVLGKKKFNLVDKYLGSPRLR